MTWSVATPTWVAPPRLIIPRIEATNPADGAYFSPLIVPRRGDREEVAEEFIRAVDEMDQQDG